MNTSIKKDSYVEFNLKGEKVIGLVKKGGANVEVVFLRGDERRIVKASALHFKVVPASLAPKGLEIPKPIKKGMWVSFTSEGESYVGMCIKGGANPTVAFTDNNGQAMEIRGGVQCFTEADMKDVPVLVTSDVMKDYEITGYKSLGYGHDSEMFKCTVRFKGKPVVEVSNSGWGGCDDIHPMGKCTHTDVKAFIEATTKWAKTLSGREDVFEPTDAYIDWHNHDKPCGVSDKAYWDNRNKRMAELNAGGPVSKN